ncbi:MerR family transcriptional regulator [Microbacterium flavum]|uniref:MerR family transcriptional regulator n=1 Tax=Microbacterium flavum TaxID=415216 RepID=A0ABS5XPN3_9MICO|nr:MerR family transcriptional regulator [Microbacterium flavum]MBT8796484.1 MerR family transcriptional regulator [Microbacterium flavum]
MDGGTAALMSIGDFSRYSGLSVRMLRHYAERGVLVPVERDDQSGYRRYSPVQLSEAARVRMLRDAGCGIPAIAELLPLFAHPDALRSRLQDHLDDLAEQARRVADQRDLATHLLDALELRTRGPEVTERVFPALRVLYLRRTVADYPAEGSLWADFQGPYATLSADDPAVFGDVVGATYFDDEYRDADVEMAIWREYRGGAVPRGGFEVVDLPAQRVATVTHRGGFETIGDATAAAGAWLSAQRRTRTGPIFNVYAYGPGRDPDPSTWVTEVNVPIAG